MGDRPDIAVLECVPNVSEGRDAALLREIGAAFASAGAVLADTHADPDHHRSVFTLFGTAGQLERGVLAAAEVIVGRVDISQHLGVHPRVGALDVVPVVPLEDYIEGGAGELDAVLCADRIAQVLGDRMDVPAIRYGLGVVPGADGGPAPTRTGHLRIGELQQRIDTGAVEVFAGPRTLHARMGATMVGVRDVLVACNVELATADLQAARDIAAVVRESAGGLPGVRALGLATPHRHSVQVSTNIERWRDAGPAELLERVLDLAAVIHVHVASVELVGLAPREAMHDLGIACKRNRVPLRSCREPGLEIRARLAREKIIAAAQRATGG